MKILYVIVAVVILGAGWYFYTNTAPEDATPSDELTTPEDLGAVEEHEMDDAEMAEEENETEVAGGDDAGMEFPTIDSEAGAGAALSVDPDAQVFDIGGRSFEFDVKEIRVKEGETVTINFTSNDGFHDWVIDEFDANTSRVQTGETSSVTFVADRKGTFEYYCSVGQHRANGMVGTLIVE